MKIYTAQDLKSTLLPRWQRGPLVTHSEEGCRLAFQPLTKELLLSLHLQLESQRTPLPPLVEYLPTPSPVYNAKTDSTPPILLFSHQAPLLQGSSFSSKDQLAVRHCQLPIWKESEITQLSTVVMGSVSSKSSSAIH